MDTPGFGYIDGQLCCDGTPVSDIAARYGTPCYLYSKKNLLARLAAFRKAFSSYEPLVCFSVKSLSNLSILRLVSTEGCGFDVVSGGELYRVIKAGGAPSKTVFAGVGKTEFEIRFALRHNIHMFNVESAGELHLIQKTAADNGCVANVALRINPDVDAGTHEKTTTGKKENKFGIDLETAYQLGVGAKKLGAVNLCGLHVHLGSPIYETAPYVTALEKVAEFRSRLAGVGVEIDTVNLGGGYCMSYTGEDVLSPCDYARAMKPVLDRMKVRVILEPGRHISAPAGLLLARVVYRKETRDGRKFIITDTAMNDLLRPALYGAFHRIWPVSSMKGMPDIIRPDDPAPDGFDTEKVDIAGPVCESGDIMAKGRWIPRVNEGDLLAIFDTGAYGSTMSSNYNGRTRAAEVLAGDNRPVLVTRRETYRDLIAREELTAV